MPASYALSMIAKEGSSSAWLPKVMVPRQSAETLRPLRPSRRTSIDRFPRAQSRQRFERGACAGEGQAVPDIDGGSAAALPAHNGSTAGALGGAAQRPAEWKMAPHSYL